MGKSEEAEEKAPPSYQENVEVTTIQPTSTNEIQPVIVQTAPQVIMTQPKTWKRPWQSISWCDSECCLACWALPCYFGRVYAKFEGEETFCGKCCLRCYCPWFCWIGTEMALQNRIAARQGVQAPNAGCLAMYFCEPCVLASMYYELLDN
ncbi:Oidioi.mRNA.OKI2018_I69.chr2.g5095.t1.cds [Oikopleura dioica]|uniref:Oidioi.mRNA.OKI2018_I69.chr2.g5095.t1.cds n=1 Tax=Oikopleura dioica TaxID=34765 RepID=A0ABN7SYY5_OIKDI|nr:Oidioi.mRNA.OKI2018_I69.chr2.g5095.t1.cds [Oikopleura dioica]